MDLQYTRPYLYPKQSQAFFHGRRYGLTEASTKAGKTVAAIAWIIELALKGVSGQNYWWVAPVSDQAKIAFTRIKAGLPPGMFHSVESPVPKITLINGAIIWFKSGDNPDSLFGEDVWGAVVDEASRVKEDSWFALRSTLTATLAPVNIIGNVKGKKNWFYRLARQAEREAGDPGSNMHYSKITVIDARDAGVIPQSEVDDARKVLPEHVFRELYMAEPGDDSGNPFGEEYIARCVIERRSEAPVVAFGIDLAKKHDYLVIIGLDAEGKEAGFWRWHGASWEESVRRIRQIVGDDTPALVDSTGVGDPVVEYLQKDGYSNIQGFTFSASSKQKLMEGLAVAIQNRDIGFTDGVIRTELEAFEYQLTRTGVLYSAPEGYHDDCVCALALAVEKKNEVSPAKALLDYYRGIAREARAAREAEFEREDEGPRRAPSVPSIAQVDDELTALYRKTIEGLEPEERRCRLCGGRVAGNRVSDGVFVWHTGCY